MSDLNNHIRQLRTCFAPEERLKVDGSNWKPWLKRFSSYCRLQPVLRGLIPKSEQKQAVNVKIETARVAALTADEVKIRNDEALKFSDDEILNLRRLFVSCALTDDVASQLMSSGEHLDPELGDPTAIYKELVKHDDKINIWEAMTLKQEFHQQQPRSIQPSSVNLYFSGTLLAPLTNYAFQCNITMP